MRLHCLYNTGLSLQHGSVFTTRVCLYNTGLSLQHGSVFTTRVCLYYTDPCSNVDRFLKISHATRFATCILIPRKHESLSSTIRVGRYVGKRGASGRVCAVYSVCFCVCILCVGSLSVGGFVLSIGGSVPECLGPCVLQTMFWTTESGFVS